MSKAMDAALAAIAVPWRQREGTAMVEAYSPKLQGWAVVAEGRDTPELKARDIAALIISAISGSGHDEKLIGELTRSLEVCLNGEMDFSAEQEADAALRMAGERRKPSMRRR
jgi:hypothetical protein